ncbi:MAG TPA: tetratricopeptide repeat protein, partial [Candidatus Limnocylindria bacterium]|nr:tetratricopeptide repeat protein [Candidatus Limnocylindria bacterium]
MAFRHRTAARARRGCVVGPRRCDRRPSSLTVRGAVWTLGLTFVLALLWAASDDAQAAAGTRPGRTATTGASAPAVPAVTAPPASEPPSDHRNLEAWLAYQGQLGITHLPDQARLFYRRGLIAWQSGQDAEALRLVRGAAQLDPSFLEPQLALAAWFVTREPSQALLRAATVLEQGREQFLLQIQWIANASFVTFHALFFGVLAAGWLVILLHQGELRHACQERLSRFLSPGTSRSWAWVLLLLPLVAGFGIALPAILLMGLLWPVLRGRERVLYVMLVAVVATAPLAGALIGGFAVPLRAGAAPLFGAPALENEPYTPALQERQTQLAEQHADNPFVQFGLGWTARRGGDLAAAEAAYRRTLTHWPNDDRLLNNLGTVLAAQGRLDEALVFCHRASDANPNNAAAFFNAAQIHTGRFDYHAANEALARASALNFELVKNYQGQSARDGSLPLVDQWIAPAVSWKALLDSGIDLTTRPALPPTWIARYEASGLA